MLARGIPRGAINRSYGPAIQMDKNTITGSRAFEYARKAGISTRKQKLCGRDGPASGERGTQDHFDMTASLPIATFVDACLQRLTFAVRGHTFSLFIAAMFRDYSFSSVRQRIQSTSPRYTHVILRFLEVAIAIYHRYHPLPISTNLENLKMEAYKHSSQMVKMLAYINRQLAIHTESDPF